MNSPKVVASSTKQKEIKSTRIFKKQMQSAFMENLLKNDTRLDTPGNVVEENQNRIVFFNFCLEESEIEGESFDIAIRTSNENQPHHIHMGYKDNKYKCSRSEFIHKYQWSSLISMHLTFPSSFLQIEPKHISIEIPLTTKTRHMKCGISILKGMLSFEIGVVGSPSKKDTITPHSIHFKQQDVLVLFNNLSHEGIPKRFLRSIAKEHNSIDLKNKKELFIEKDIPFRLKVKENHKDTQALSTLLDTMDDLLEVQKQQKEEYIACVLGEEEHTLSFFRNRVFVSIQKALLYKCLIPSSYSGNCYLVPVLIDANLDDTLYKEALKEATTTASDDDVKIFEVFVSIALRLKKLSVWIDQAIPMNHPEFKNSYLAKEQARDKLLRLLSFLSQLPIRLF
mmetsp:Transcript_9862/g.14541  ORF Transcript_9862/g.14541 Transcript_9862/m.14541 type:complete len:395 (+) Transcript_9862:42-1226(+)